jgi:hypothetical protein
MNGKMYQINCSKDLYFQYFGIPLLLVAKQIFGKLLDLSETLGASHLENCGETPKNFFDQVHYVLRTKGICSSKFTAANINVHGQFDPLIPTHCFYPFLRALQMVHSSFQSSLASVRVSANTHKVLRMNCGTTAKVFPTSDTGEGSSWDNCSAH